MLLFILKVQFPPMYSDMLNTCASGVLICSTIYFSIFGDIASTPGDLFSFILLILLATIWGYNLQGVVRPKYSRSRRKGPFKCYVTLFFCKLDPHPPPRNVNNIEHYTFVTLFSGKSDTPPPPSALRNT